MNTSKDTSLRSNASGALEEKTLQEILRRAGGSFALKRQSAFSQFPLEDRRNTASEIRLKALNNLEKYIQRFKMNASKAGVQVHKAKTGQDANMIVGDILKDHGIKRSQ
jgi:L-lactate utilization protein LutB